ncbi:MAG TPA: ATP-binding SpoIIE family protein phosphatase [Acidimicrobiales bacterium]|nr:ATP-binding SpoIIE family protein phosphatase [Acidimicrobiales bacterium]
MRVPGRDQHVAADPESQRVPPGTRQPSRAEVLDAVSHRLGASLDPAALVARLADAVASRFGGGAVWLADDHGLRRVAVRPSAGDTGPPARVGLDGRTPVARAYRSGDLQPAVEDPSAGGAWSSVAVPLLAGGTAMGVLQVVVDRDLGTEQASLALAIGARAGRALHHALRFQRQRALLDALTGPAVPPDLVVPGLDLEADLRRSGPAEVDGSTWYDAVELDDGFLFFSLGEVVDPDPTAAVLMAQVRGAMRAYVVDYPSPATVLAGVDRLLGVLRERRPVAAVAAVADPTTGEVWLSNAGHPAPLLVPPSGPAIPVDAARSGPLGIGRRTERPEHRLVLRRGDTLLLHSGNRAGGVPVDLPAAAGLGPPESVPLDRWVAGLTAAMVGTAPVRGDSSDRGTAGGSGDGTGDAAAVAVRYRGDRRRDAGHPVGAARPTGRHPSGGRHDAARPAPRLQLPPLTASAPAARRWVADQLMDLPDDLVDTATLLTSELVANAVLHAGTDVIVSIHRGEERVRIDVADGHPAGPVVKDYGPDAATGRGLTLFDRLASAWGTRPIIPQGKIVWFELPVDIPGEAVETGALPFDLDPWPEPAFAVQPDPAVDVGPTVPVRLLDVPVAALNRASEQYEALFREFRLVVEQGPSNPGGAPERLIALIDELGTRFAGFTAGMDEEWRAALDRGDPTVDLALQLPRQVGEACEHYDHLLDQADHFCRAAELITLPATAEAVALRKWFLLEFAHQAAGAAPVPWPRSAWARGLDTPPAPPRPFAPIRRTGPGRQ